MADPRLERLRRQACPASACFGSARPGTRPRFARRLPARLVLANLALCLGAASMVARAGAQDTPDVRNVRPMVMLLVDTSMSMEYMPDYQPSGTTTGCGTPGACPVCLGGATDPRNRWAITLEALTGTFQDYSCTRLGDSLGFRTGAPFVGPPQQYDFRAPMPHFRPNYSGQVSDGVLDAYIDRVRFGLMTFDGAGTLVPSASPYVAADVTEATYLANLGRANGMEGMFSYGRDATYNFPGCPTYMMNNGARSKNASAGALVSVGDETADFRAVNAAIQEQLLAVRPFGGTPIAGMLDDARYWLQNDPDVADPRVVTGGDPYFQCRPRYLLLLTDGYPDSDKRTGTINCEQPGGSCPYDRAEDIAQSLCQPGSGSGTCDGAGKLIDGLFVVGFSVTDPTSVARLNLLAQRGGTGAALFATDKATLMTALASALDRAAVGVTTRTSPTFASTGPGGSQMQFNTGFLIGNSTRPWTGVLSRTRYTCSATLEPEAQPRTVGDEFHEVLNARSAPRRLLTVLPASTANATGWLTGMPTGPSPLGPTSGPGSPDQQGLSLTPFTKANAALTRSYFGVGTDARRNEIIDWIHGEPGTPRQNARLGDIYHSNPVVVGPPRVDIADESYNLFRQQPAIASRPTVLYVGTNDGILHAFATENYTYTAGPRAGTSVSAGEELWGFIPPAFLPKLDAAVASHQVLFDGTPIVKEIFYERGPGTTPTDTLYRTVLISALRGSPGYVALDVTDPLEPIFLWQYATPDLGPGYGQPGVGQMLVRRGGELVERGIALLPGGLGTENAAYYAGHARDQYPGGPAGCPGRVGSPAPPTKGIVNPRVHQRCWGTIGRSLAWIDIATGTRLERFDHTLFDAPLAGGVSLFPGDVGQVATRAFVTDQEGVVWRIDFSSPSPMQWRADPFYDLFNDPRPGEQLGGSAFHPPVLSTDLAGNVVVMQATGDIDQLDSAAYNRIASVTEKLTCNTLGAKCFETELNWEVRLALGEQVTGPMELFDGNLYFATFTALTDPSNACTYGTTRLWGVDYLQSGAGGSQPTPFPKGAFETSPGSGVFTQRLADISNAIIVGVGVAQRPTCTAGLTEADPYFGGSRYQVTGVGGGEFQLVAQVSGQAGVAAGSVGTIVRTLTPPASFTAVQSWAGAID
jgi:type IV pilus assembly protein PilY1